jgi:hypothetical protein
VFTQTKVDPQGSPIRDPDSTTYIGAIETAEKFGFSIYTETWRRGWEWATIQSAIADGAVRIWNLADQHVLFTPRSGSISWSAYARLRAEHGETRPRLAEKFLRGAEYFATNASRMRYPQFREKGLFVGSRLKRPGTFRTGSAAPTPFIALRYCRINGGSRITGRRIEWPDQSDIPK